MSETVSISSQASLSSRLFQSLHLLYGPLIGKEALCLYEAFVCLGMRKGQYELEHLQKCIHLTPTRFTYARHQLEQYDLMQTYQDAIHNEWLFVVQNPKEPLVFLEHDVYSRIYLEKEGSKQLDRMKLFFSSSIDVSSQMVNVSEPLDVSILDYWTQEKEDALEKHKVMPSQGSAYPFDFQLVFKGMDRVIPQRLRTRENLERIYDLARIFGVDEKTMRRYLSLSIDPSKTHIDFESLRNRVLSARKTHTQTQDPYTMAPVAYLQWKQNDMPVAKSDKLLLEKLMAEYRLPSEVINVLIDYALQMTNQKFTRSFVEKVASSWARLKIDTREKALAQTSYSPKTGVEEQPSWYADTSQSKPDAQLQEEIAKIQDELRKEKHGED